MRPPFFYPPNYPVNPAQIPYGGYSPFSFRPPVPRPRPQMPMQMPMQMPPGMSPGMSPGVPAAGIPAAGLAAAAAAAPAAAAAATSVPQLDTLLAGANSLFTNAQKFTPYIQQAAPMFKNIPALWRMYKGFKSQPDLDDSTSIAGPVRRENSAPQPQERSQPRSQPLTTRPSVPRIYQPPYDF